MKQKDVVLLVAVLVLSVIVSVVVSNMLFSSTKSLQQVGVVDKITPDFPVEQVTGPGDLTIEAVAEKGYVLTGQTSWTFSFTYQSAASPDAPPKADESTPNQPTDEQPNPKEPIQVKPAAPVFYDTTGAANDTYIIPSVTGVQYKVNGVVTAAGTYTGPTKQFTEEAFNPAQIVKIGQPNNHPFADGKQPQ